MVLVPDSYCRSAKKRDQHFYNLFFVCRTKKISNHFESVHLMIINCSGKKTKKGKQIWEKKIENREKKEMVKNSFHFYCSFRKKGMLLYPHENSSKVQQKKKKPSVFGKKGVNYLQ